MKLTTKIAHIITSLLIIVNIFMLTSCKHNSTEKIVHEILRNDLNSSVEIIKLYYSEDKYGYFVEFKTNSYTDKAAIKLENNAIEYESEYNYWVAKAEQLRKQKPINEIELHKYNQKIINSFYAEWNFSVVVFEANGRPEDSDWKRIK